MELFFKINKYIRGADAVPRSLLLVPAKLFQLAAV